MKISKILVPYDGSDSSKNAVAYAADIVANNPEAKIVAFASLAGPHDINRLLGGTQATVNIGAGKETVEHYQKVREDTTNANMERMKREVGEVLDGQAVDVDYEIEYCVSPVKGILDAVENYEADMVVMGSRGKNAIAGMLGSVSFGVIRSAKVPVTIVK